MPSPSSPPTSSTTRSPWKSSSTRPSPAGSSRISTTSTPRSSTTPRSSRCAGRRSVAEGKSGVDLRLVLHQCSHMRTATVRDLRNHYTSLLSWIRGGEEIVITQRGKAIARLIPEKPEQRKTVNWADAPEVTRDRSGEVMLTHEESLNLIHDAASKW